MLDRNADKLAMARNRMIDAGRRKTMETTYGNYPGPLALLDLVGGGLPVPIPQFRIVNFAGDEIYRLDFAWPELRVAVEYDGYAAHEGRQEQDEAREADLRRRGWIVIRADASDLKDPRRLIAEVRAAFRVRGLAA